MEIGSGKKPGERIGIASELQHNTNTGERKKETHNRFTTQQRRPGKNIYVLHENRCWTCDGDAGRKQGERAADLWAMESTIIKVQSVGGNTVYGSAD